MLEYFFFLCGRMQEEPDTSTALATLTHRTIVPTSFTHTTVAPTAMTHTTTAPTTFTHTTKGQ
jgi:hypothetical protein